MKTSNNSYITLLLYFCLMVLSFTKAHSQWELGGNPTINPVNDWLGTLDNDDLRFRTDSIQRTCITQTGQFGHGIMVPQAFFHVDSGTVLFTGHLQSPQGNNPNLGAGTRMMWIPNQGAIRAGESFGTGWDAPNVGTNSAVFGSGSVARAPNSFAACSTNIIDVNGFSSAAFGSSNSVSGSSSLVAGSNNSSSGNDNCVIGSTNVINSSQSASFGTSNQMGAGGSWNVITGKLNVIGANVNGSALLGCFLQTTASNTAVLGSGVITNPLVNTIQNSMMVGFNSNLPYKKSTL